MQYDFTQDVRVVLQRARDAALERRHDYVGTEHLLAGLVSVPDSRGAALLHNLGVDGAMVAERLDALVVRGRSVLPGGVELPYTSRAKKTLELMMAEGRDEGASALDSGHFLIGLLREENGIAARVLDELGVTLSRVRALRAGLPVPPAPPAATREDARGDAAAASAAGAGAGGPDAGFRIAVDDASDRSIYEQIVARVQEAVATGELAPGDRLPSVRSLADRLDIAPGTVARAWGELERLGVVITQGARGTRVAAPAAPSPPPAADLATLAGLLRPAAVAAFHMGARAADMRRALEQAMTGIFADAQDT